MGGTIKLHCIKNIQLQYIPSKNTFQQFQKFLLHSPREMNILLQYLFSFLPVAVLLLRMPELSLLFSNLCLKLVFSRIFQRI